MTGGISTSGSIPTATSRYVITARFQANADTNDTRVSMTIARGPTGPAPTTAYINLANGIALSTTPLAIVGLGGTDTMLTSLANVVLHQQSSNGGGFLFTSVLDNPGTSPNNIWYYALVAITNDTTTIVSNIQLFITQVST